MKYHYNNEFENIDTEDKAYILGLFYADGFVTYNEEKYNYFSGIKLHNQDVELLNKIKEKFDFFNIKIEDNHSILRCNQKKFCQDMIKNGVLPLKSSINKNNLKFPKLSSFLISHFIRGYFDGDGSIYFNKNNSKNSKGFTFTGDNYKFIKKIQEILYYEQIPMVLKYNRNSTSIIRGKEVEFNTLTFCLINQNKTIIKKASLFLYKNAELYIERKNIIFNTWYEKIKTPCPKCKSLNTSWQIKNIYLKCNNCKSYSKIDCPIT